MIYSHEIKRYLLLGGNAMTNLDSIWKSRDSTLPTKVHVVKAMVFPGVMDGCESQTIMKAECWRNRCFQIVVLEKTLERSLDSKKIKPVNSLEKILMLGKMAGKKRRGWQRMRSLDSITDSMDMNLSKRWETVEYTGAWYAIVHRIAKNWTQLSNWTTTLSLNLCF